VNELGIDLTIQMCTYNRKDLLLKALDALFNQNYPKDRYEIILVDDGSTDGTGEAVSNLKSDCNLKYIYQDNSGLAVGRNKGITQAKGRIVLFVDDDIIASERLVKEHIVTHDVYPKSVVRGWVNHVDSLEKFNRNIEESKLKFTMQDISTSFFWTSNVSVEKKYLEEVGLFDETFNEYGWEDIELGIRLKKLGLKLKYNNNAVVLHYKSCWKKSQIPSLLKQARSKGNTAVIFLEKHPVLNVKLATGIYPLRIFIDNLFKKGLLEICERVVSEYSGEELKGFALFCARQLYTFEYYKAIRERL
jgi:glycosyltransferase involved in cell wall biosynthesis